ncbi:methionine biosynthesis protein MetW [Methylophaga sp.]|uniref:methionine biosynthesis protein MetW n=1 Tax=Methylophaga sp. TaxID=2024840 RepID=UPI00271EB690|nr:methionine biosynthesis protein MetW [Methylophaga sp.]MDO8826282.1 methionine biosynthesis protein MetW [Methylophaga sp.]
MTLRVDLQIISDWIPDNSHVLDLGCGNGALLKHLQQRNVTGYGLEIDNSKFTECIESGVNVIQADLDVGLGQFADQSFDFVILSQTLQAVKRPDFLLREIMRVGKQGIIGFPNFGHWQCRVQLGLGGKMPVSKNLPNAWFDTPNIHLCTLKDFEKICDQYGFSVVNRSVVNHEHKDTLGIRLLPNLFGQTAVYLIHNGNS